MFVYTHVCIGVSKKLRGESLWVALKVFQLGSGKEAADWEMPWAIEYSYGSFHKAVRILCMSRKRAVMINDPLRS